jgi:hypothetical protein
VIHVSRGSSAGDKLLDGDVVDNIGADLRRRSGFAAARLAPNNNISFKGVDFGGIGFLLEPNEASSLIGKAPEEGRFIWSVINATDLTNSPNLRPFRKIINLTGLSLQQAEALAPACMAIVRDRVLPHRRGQKRAANRERWWLYNETRPGLYSAVAGLSRVLVNPVVSKYISFVFLKPHMVFTNVLNVFAFESDEALCLLQSRVHEAWAVLHGSTLRVDVRYNPTDCFETFPFAIAWESNRALKDAGREYDEFRTALMVRNNEGLTKTYNRFHDPYESDADILTLRDLHATMDRAVLDAYGWTDIQTKCEFILESEDEDEDEENEAGGRPSRKKKPWRYRWPDEVRDEVLGRLLELNAKRASEEARRDRSVRSTRAKRQTRSTTSLLD